TAVDLLSHTALRDQVEFYLSAMQTKIDSIPKTGIKYLVCPGTPPSPKTWTPGLLGQFQKLRGYSPLPFLPVLNNYTVLNRTTSERFLCDFYKTLSEILKDNHTRVSREIFEKYGLYLFTTNPCASSGQYSTAGKCHPETQSNDSYQDDPEGFFPLTCNAYSLNTHTPVNSQLVVPWPAGTMVRPWFDFLSRCAFLLQQGHLMADILFYMGDHPSDIGQYFSLTSWQKYGYNCDMCATDDILFQLDVKNGNIVRPDGAEAKLLVLTNTKDINPLALKKIQQLVIAGATVIGPKPETSIGLSFGQYGDELVRDIADRMWKNINSGGYQMKNYGRGWVVCGESVQDVFAQRGVERNFSFTSIFDSADVDFIHRQTSTRDIFFIANRKNRRELLNCFFRTEKDHPQIWNPADGTIMNPAVYRQTETGIRMPLKLEPLSTLFVVFENLSQNHILSISKDNIPVFPYQEHGISIDEQPDAVCKQNFIHLHIWTPGEYSLLTTGNLAQLFYVEKIPSVQTDTKWQVFFERDSSSLHHQNTSERHNEETSPKSDTGSQPAAVKFKKQFTVPQLTELEEFNAFLMIDHMNIPGRIYLNGIKLGVLWNSTFKMDITRVLKRGANSLVYEPAENGQRTLKLLEKGTQSRGENRSPNPSDFETFLQDHTSIRFAKRMILDL
ncbi:hypothetical protein JW935_11335, partial [candidate division KSB1 bacterium]|nr:hypothetical protein [candidate division KSB1 bacterium]